MRREDLSSVTRIGTDSNPTSPPRGSDEKAADELSSPCKAWSYAEVDGRAGWGTSRKGVWIQGSDASHCPEKSKRHAKAKWNLAIAKCAADKSRVKGCSWGGIWWKVEEAQLTVIACEVLQNLLSQVKHIGSLIVFIICFELFDDGVIEKVIAASIYIDVLGQSVVEALRFRQSSEVVAPLTLWMVPPKLMATKRFRLHIADRYV